MESDHFLSFCVWLISLSMMFSRFIHVVACIKIILLFKAEQYSVVCMCHILFICLPFDGLLCCFDFLAFVNNAVLNVGIQVICLGPCFQLFGVYYLKVELLDHMVILCLTF